jgi:Xaa-Pro aminopeptidase
MTESVAPGIGDEILGKTRRAMLEQGLDALVATSPENMAYVSGAISPSQKAVRSRLAAAIVPLEGETEVVTIGIDGPVVASQSRLDSIRTYQEFVEDPVEVFAASMRERGLSDGLIGIEQTHLSFAERIAVEACASFGPSSTEREIASFIAQRYAEEDADGLTMLVVGSGPRSSVANAPPTGRALERGDVLRLDIIGTKAHYHSDVARTAVVCEPTDEQQRVYDLLLGVHRRCLEALRPGALSSDVYRIYRDAMDAARLPPYHFVGHGLGITLHEEPFVNELKSIPLEEGMVLCIEPLTLIEGHFGMQIEDEVVITADGYEPFSEAGALLRLEG